MSVKIKIKKLKPSAVLPGTDLHACLPGMGESLASGEIKPFSTGISVDVPEGYELQVRSSSSLVMQGIVVLNAPVTVDCNHKTEIIVVLLNAGKQGRRFAHGEKIAQLVCAKVEHIQWALADERPTKRGSK